MKGIKAHVLSFGRERFIPRHMIFGGEKNNKDLITIPMYGVLIEHPDGLVLFDAGTNLADEIITSKWRSTGRYDMRPDESPEVQLLQLGYMPEDVKYLVVSHLHPDHAGWIHLFTNAQVLVSDRELIYRARNFMLKQDSNPHEILFWQKYDINWVTITDHVTKLLPGITVYEFGPGHVGGMLVMLVELENHGNILIVSDAIYAEQCLYSADIPGYNESPKGYLETKETLIGMAKEFNAEIWFSHDSEQFDKMKKAPNEYYD